MKPTLIIIAVAAICVLRSYGQSFTPIQQMGLNGAFESVLLHDGQRWLVRCQERDSTRFAFCALSDRWAVRKVDGQPWIPFEGVSYRSICLSSGEIWIGGMNYLAHAEPGGEWATIDISEPGREVRVDALTAVDGIGVLASVTSYKVDRIDSVGGAPIKYTSQHRSQVILQARESRRVIYSDTSRRFPLTNLARTSDGRYAFAFTRTASERSYIGLLALDGATEEVEAPNDMPFGTSASYIAAGPDDKLYCFFSASVYGGVRKPPFVAIYDVAAKTTRIVYTTSSGPSNAIETRIGLLASAPNGILHVSDDRCTRVPIPGPNGSALLEILDCTLISGDSVLVLARSGIVVLPLEYFSKTSSVATIPERIGMIGSRLTLEGLIDNSTSVSWTIYDDLGRVLAQGETQAGQVDLDLELPRMPGRPLNLQLHAYGRTVLFKRFMTMP